MYTSRKGAPVGKRIDELTNLDDSPIEPPDDRDTPWGRFLSEIDDLLADGHYTWAEDTLKGIYDTVAEKRWVTENQRRAVANIAAARETPGPRWSRRYQGWRRR